MALSRFEPAGILRIALLQMGSHGADQEANLAKGDAFCRRAAAMGADIALFPEMWNVGYAFPDPPNPAAIDRDSRFYGHFRALARELRMAIALTFLEAGAGAPRNVLALLDREGAEVLTYAKVHTCSFDREAVLRPGGSFPVAPLATAAGTVQVGAMICYDREFPESARILMLNGAELILTPNACELEQNRLSQFRARAFENMTALAMTNYASPQENGHSLAFDGMAFGPDGRSRDMLLAEAGAGEAVCLAELDLAALRAYRARETWGQGYRKPEVYGGLAGSWTLERAHGPGLYVP